MIKVIDYKGREYYVQSFPFKIGRGKNCDVILDDQTVSKVHLVLDKIDERIYLFDCDSKNGTLINNEKKSDVQILDDTICKLGDLDIKILFSKNEDETREINLPDELFIKESDFSLCLPSLFLLFVVELLRFKLTIFSLAGGNLITDYLTIIIISVTISGLLSIATKYFKNTNNFYLYFRWCNYWIALFAFTSLISDYINFYLPVKLWKTISPLITIGPILLGPFLYLKHIYPHFFGAEKSKTMMVLALTSFLLIRFTYLESGKLNEGHFGTIVFPVFKLSSKGPKYQNLEKEVQNSVEKLEVHSVKSSFLLAE